MKKYSFDTDSMKSVLQQEWDDVLFAFKNRKEIFQASTVDSQMYITKKNDEKMSSRHVSQTG
jgi:uncharacterized protein YqgV (UPF0045/DUF77 family)